MNIDKLRIETPSCKELIHFNNAGAALQPECVVQSVIQHLQSEQKIGGYRAEIDASEKLNSFYNNFSQLLNCSPGEIAYIENATRAWGMAFYSIPLKKGDKILTSTAEYASNYLAFLQAVNQYGVVAQVIPNDNFGQVCIQSLEDMIDEQVKLIAITHVPTNGGLINPAEQIGQIAKKYGILYLLDACQSVGQLMLDVEKIQCDFLTGTGRKYLRGPRGTGFLYLRQNIIEKLHPPFIDLHAATWVTRDTYDLKKDAKRFENWESYVAGKIGLAEAVKYALDIGIESIEKRVVLLGSILRKQLEEIPGIKVQDLGNKKCGIVSFTKESEKPSELQIRVEQKGINVSVSKASSTRIDMEERGLDELVRASVHYYNTEVEIARFCSVVGSES